MTKVSKTSETQPRTRVPRNDKKGRAAPPLSGRYARSEGAGPGPDRHHNGPKRRK
jgi:hypothetical protein